MTTLRWMLIACLLTAACSDSPDSDPNSTSGPSNLSTTNADPNNDSVACNNTTVRCPDGYEYVDDESCEDQTRVPCATSESGECLENVECTCAVACDDVYLDSCDGVPECVEKDACGQQIFCVTCAEPPDCGDREVAGPACPPNSACRVETCTSNPAIDYRCFAVGQDCDTVACPEGLQECDTPSATCVETETCGELRLCEPV